MRHLISTADNYISAYAFIIQRYSVSMERASLFLIRGFNQFFSLLTVLAGAGALPTAPLPPISLAWVRRQLPHIQGFNL